ncbi:MAG TPA: hypothetical protein V6C99_02845 [Oculatellaceae cyanobacterium]
MSALFPNQYAAYNIRKAKGGGGFADKLANIFAPRRYTAYQLAKQNNGSGFRKIYQLVVPEFT